ncbi:MAG: hypothetical protein R2712_03405 [Vicinamibacterales bacterium]
MTGVFRARKVLDLLKAAEVLACVEADRSRSLPAPLLARRRPANRHRRRDGVGDDLSLVRSDARRDHVRPARDVAIDGDSLDGRNIPMPGRRPPENAAAGRRRRQACMKGSPALTVRESRLRSTRPFAVICARRPVERTCQISRGRGVRGSASRSS